MKSYSSREIIELLREDGWAEVRCEGDHHHFRHAWKPGVTTVPHPVKDVKIKTLKSIERQSGLKFRR